VCKYAGHRARLGIPFAGNHPEMGRCGLGLRVPQDCPQAVADLCKECSAKDPAQRPTSKELIERLTAATNQAPPSWLREPRHVRQLPNSLAITAGQPVNQPAVELPPQRAGSSEGMAQPGRQHLDSSPPRSHNPLEAVVAKARWVEREVPVSPFLDLKKDIEGGPLRS
jgi:hypothetical protein